MARGGGEMGECEAGEGAEEVDGVEDEACGGEGEAAGVEEERVEGEVEGPEKEEGWDGDGEGGGVPRGEEERQGGDGGGDGAKTGEGVGIEVIVSGAVVAAHECGPCEGAEEGVGDDETS